MTATRDDQADLRRDLDRLRQGLDEVERQVANLRAGQANLVERFAERSRSSQGVVTPPLAATPEAIRHTASDVSGFALAEAAPVLADVVPVVVAQSKLTAPGSPATPAGRLDAGPSDFESKIGGQLLTWVGSVVLLLAVGFTVHWLWVTFQPPPWLRVAGLHGLGLALVGAGAVVGRRYLPLLGQGLFGLGAFTLYATAYAALELYGVYSPTVAFVECAAITALTVLAAVRINSPAIVLLGGLGGYVTPLLTAGDSGSHVALFLYLAFLNLALLASAVWRRWEFLKPLTLLATAAMFGMWLTSGQWPDHRWSTLLLGGVHALLFVGATSLPALLWKRRTTPFDVSSLLSSSLGFLGLAWVLFHELPTQQLALLCWSLAAASLAAFAATYARLGNDDRLPRVYLALAAVFFTLAVPLQLDDYRFLAVVWALEALIFSAVGVYFCDVQLRVTGVVVFALAIIRLLSFDLPDRSLLELSFGTWQLNFVTIAACGLLGMLAGALHWVLPRRGESGPLDRQLGPALAGALLVAGNLLVLLAIHCQWQGRVPLVAATLDAALIWAIGFRADNRWARSYASAVGVLLAGVLALMANDRLEGPFRLVANARFGSLALLAATYLAAGWYYWKHVGAAAPARRGLAPSLDDQLADVERNQHVLLAVLGNAALLVAITFDVLGWFHEERMAARNPFPNMQMAQQATLSGVWAIYAACLVAVGFALRYRVHRLLGLAAFLPIIAKVFFVDLANLELMPRVLALAVLGIMLLGTSALYQRYAARLRAAGREGS